MINIPLITVLLTYFLVWFVINNLLNNAGLIDIAWGLGFVLLALTQYLIYPGSYSLVIVSMVMLWGLRLAYFIGLRNIGKEEDHRYQQFRKDWGKSYLIRSVFQIYLLQAVLMLVVSMAFLDGIRRSELKSVPLFVIGIVLYSIGFYFEVVSDYQMKKYKNDLRNKGKLMTSGLWSMSRHPNYFGEATLWLGIASVSVALGSSLVAYIGAFTIFYLVRYLSGTPLMEKRIKTYSEFDVYSKNVPIFFPKIKGEKNL